MAKECASCSLTKPYEEFYRKPRYDLYPDSSAGRSHKCKVCANAERQAYRAANKDKCKISNDNSRLKRVYGIDLKIYNFMLESQDYRCKGCTRHQSEFKKGLVVDHCHTTGQVRGLLCTPCNLTLGYVRENTQVLENLVTYLNNSTELAVITSGLSSQSTMKVG